MQNNHEKLHLSFEFRESLKLKYQYISPLHSRHIDKTTQTLIYSYGEIKCVIPNHIKYLIINNRDESLNIIIPSSVKKIFFIPMHYLMITPIKKFHLHSSRLNSYDYDTSMICHYIKCHCNMLSYVVSDY